MEMRTNPDISSKAKKYSVDFLRNHFYIHFQGEIAVYYPVL